MTKNEMLQRDIEAIANTGLELNSPILSQVLDIPQIELQKIQLILFWALFLGTEQHHTIRKHSNLI